MNDRTTYFSKKILLCNVFMTFCIVVLHSVPTIKCGLQFDFETTPFIYSIFIFTQIAVPFFFFMSGMLFYRTCDYSNLLTKLKTRLFSLVIPYLLWCIIIRLMFYGVSVIPYIGNKLNNTYSISSFWEFVTDVIGGKYTDLWMVKYLIYYLILSPIIVYVLKKIYLSILSLLLIFIVALYNNFNYWSIYTWLFMYYLGGFCGKYFYHKLNENVILFANTNRYMKLIITICLILLFLLLLIVTITNGYIRPYWLLSPLIFWLLTDLILGKYIKNRFAPKKWMTYTFFIYCSHHFTLIVFHKFILNIIPHKLIYLDILFIISPIIVIPILIAVANFLSRFSFYKYLSGGR